MDVLEQLTRPLFVAPMAGGVSTVALVAAAGDAGAAGFLPLGYRTPEDVAADVRRLRSTEVPYGLNIFVPRPGPEDRDAVLGYRERLAAEAERYGLTLPAPILGDDDHFAAKTEIALDAAPRWVSFTFGVPAPAVVHALRRRGSAVLITVTDADEARRAVAAGADALIVQGGTAGAHSATTRPETYTGERTTVEVLAEVRAGTDVPLVATGGVGTADDVRALLAAGAVAVQCGTMFLLATEAGTREPHRAALGTATGTVVTRAFTGHPARALTNRFTAAHSGYAPIAYPAVHHLTAGLRAAAARAGDANGLNLWAGTAFRHARAGSTREILDRLS